eukprot:CAMPEP_0181491438 /NCGR_PEP_ID=MMETSP1110-20121109/50128_1 /TAXON_ID=174948 /ORGANISM="Symbiodinium sp., Strain CCMP421" /LENGTH=43 /DNA_ID= /DNA_START= /DNA_END= /DNA_ORIENTATION=
MTSFGGPWLSGHGQGVGDEAGLSEGRLGSMRAISSVPSGLVRR